MVMKNNPKITGNIGKTKPPKIKVLNKCATCCTNYVLQHILKRKILS